MTAESSLPTLAETLAWCAKDAGLEVVAEAAWPEHDGDVAVPTLAGFVVSSFSPLAAEAANRCLGRRAADVAEAADSADGAVEGSAAQDTDEHSTAVILVTARGDVQSARHVADAVDTGARIGPLMFFQSVPNAVAGHIAARWKLSGPVVCLGDPAGASAAAALLLADGDADEALLVHVEQDPDRAAAALVRLAADTDTDAEGDSGTGNGGDSGAVAGAPSRNQSPATSAAAQAAAPAAPPRPDSHSPEGGRP